VNYSVPVGGRNWIKGNRREKIELKKKIKWNYRVSSLKGNRSVPFPEYKLPATYFLGS
jgi:hypothetical protein